MRSPKMALTIIDERLTRVENALTQLSTEVTHLTQQVARLVEVSATPLKEKRFWQRE